MGDTYDVFQDIVSRCGRVKKNPPSNKPNEPKVIESYQAKCPCHDDKNPSLTISYNENGDTLLCDHSHNCTAEDIASYFGYKLSDLCANKTEKRELKALDKKVWYYANEYEWEDENGNHRKGFGEGVHVVAVYHYRDKRGGYLYSKVRFEGGAIPGKLIRYYTIDEVTNTATSCKSAEVEKVLYRFPEFLKLKDKSRRVFIVEGEKDVETLRGLKDFYFACVTTPGGTSDWRKEFSRYFKGLNVVIIRDNDSPGKIFADEIKNDLKRYAFSVSIVNPSQQHKGDVTDYLQKENGTIENLKSMIESAEVTFAPWVNVDSKSNSAKSINEGILAEAIKENEIFKIERNPLDDKETFLLYENGVYTPQNKSEMKAMISQYVPAAYITDNKMNNTRAVLFATYENIVNTSDKNAKAEYINFQNGLFNVNTWHLEPHDPDFISTFQFPFDYAPSNGCPKVFEKYITDACTKPDGSVDREQIMIIQEYMGFIFSNIPMSRIKKCLVLWSKLGDSGKSVLIRLIVSILGMQRVSSIKLLELTPQNRFILGNLPNCRLIACGDESNSNITDSSTFKALTGGDAVKIEPKGVQPISYEYRGGFVIACNGLPCFVDDKGGHLFDRLLIMPFEHHITAENKDATLDEKLQREIPGIVSWALDGLHRLIDNGYNFTQSKSSEYSKEEYRKAMDNVYRFVVENYEITLNYNDRISKSDFENLYHGWAVMDESIREVDRKNIPARMEALGIINNIGDIGDRERIMVYRGIRIPDREETNEQS